MPHNASQANLKRLQPILVQPTPAEVGAHRGARCDSAAAQHGRGKRRGSPPTQRSNVAKRALDVPNKAYRLSVARALLTAGEDAASAQSWARTRESQSEAWPADLVSEVAKREHEHWET